jgi:hypothetical protein
MGDLHLSFVNYCCLCRNTASKQQSPAGTSCRAWRRAARALGAPPSASGEILRWRRLRRQVGKPRRGGYNARAPGPVSRTAGCTVPNCPGCHGNARSVSGGLKGMFGLKVGASAAQPWERGPRPAREGRLKPSAGQCIGQYLTRARTGKPRHSGLTRAPGAPVQWFPGFVPTVPSATVRPSCWKEKPQPERFLPWHLKPI